MTVACFLALAVYGRPALANDPGISLLWSVDLKTFLESAPTLADIDTDGRDEVLVAGREELIALNKSGKELWRWRTRQRFMTYPAVLQRPGSPALIYVADTGKLFSCLDGNGRVVWQAELNAANSWSAPVLNDLNQDGRIEVVTTDQTGIVWAFDAMSGRLIWKSQIVGMPANPAAADVDQNGGSELVFITSAGWVTMLDQNGALVWRHEIGGGSADWATSSPVLFAASDRQVRIVAASNAGLVVCLDAEGNRLWSLMAQAPIASTLSVGDLDQDGRADVFLITQTGRILRIDESGTLLWDIDMQGRSLASGALIDLDDDGRLEYLLCTQNGRMIGYDVNGEIIYHYQFPCRTINMTPTFGDVGRSRDDLEMVVTGGESGLTYCFATRARKTSRAHWTSYRKDDHNTAAWFGLSQSQGPSMTPKNLLWNQITTGEEIQFAIFNPNPSTTPLQASVVCVRPDGSKRTATTQIVSRTGTLSLLLQVTMPGSYEFNWTLQTDRGKKLVTGDKKLFLQPFVNDQALATRAVAGLQAVANTVADKMPLSAVALRREADVLEKAVADLAPQQRAVPAEHAFMVEQILRNTGALVSRSRRALRMSALVEQAGRMDSSASLIAFAGSMWENRRLNEQMPDIVETPLQIHRTVVAGEHEPVSLKLFNITDRTLQVRVHLPQPPAGLVVTPHYSIPIPTSQGEEAWDALPEMDESAVVSIPSLTTREIWLDIQVGDVQPGQYVLAAVFQALNGAGVMEAPANPHGVPAPETRVQLTLEVLPFTMAPSGAVRLCTWSPNQGAELKDLLDHGNNVFTVPHGTPQHDAASHYTQADFSRLDPILAGFKGHDVVALFSGFPALEGEFGSNLYRQNLAEYLGHLVLHMQRQGVDLEHFALYPIDEPGGHGWQYVNQLVAFGKMVRDINPR
ncbi:PQQ-binding-like beta-propeller repeat protein, partial [bacterium]|nr:PQQ-binding-like beta-propeller repeat protein [bacterium]